jgi:hypothetical protein
MPAGAEAEKQAAARDMLDRRRHVGEQSRVPVRHIQYQRP